MNHVHAVVFIDHHEANVFFPAAGQEPVKHVVSHQHGHNVVDGRRAPLDRKLIDGVCAKIAGVAEVLIVGPGTAKNEFKNWLTEHKPDIARAVVGVESVDHPTSGELKNLAHKAFKRIDLWL